MAETMEEVTTIESHQSIHMVISSPGSYLFEVECEKGLFSF